MARMNISHSVTCYEQYPVHSTLPNRNLVKGLISSLFEFDSVDFQNRLCCNSVSYQDTCLAIR